MYQPDETIRLEVRMGEDTVWLNQQQMADLFQRDQSVIARHIRNIYKEEELTEEGTYAKFAYMGHDGLQKYDVIHYKMARSSMPTCRLSILSNRPSTLSSSSTTISMKLDLRLTIIK